MQDKNRKMVVLTGVSSGIGEAATKLLIERNIHVFGSVRQQADADRVAAALGPLFTPLIFDVTDEAAVQRAVTVVANALQGSRLYGLIANAGLGLQGPALHQPLSEIRQQLEVNILGLANLVQKFSPLLGTDRSRQGNPGRIIVISSVAGKLAVPFVAGYAASKHGLEGFAKSLRIELLLYGIDVVIIAAGIVATPIWQKWTRATYETTDYGKIFGRYSAGMAVKGPQGIPPEKVGQAIIQSLSVTNPAPHQVVMARPFLDWIMQRLMPARMRDRRLARKLELIE